jgi:hypothetical protein
MTRDEMVTAASHLSKRLIEISSAIRKRTTGTDYNIYSSELSSLEGIANALSQFDTDV